jgi:hypothetical protein
MNNRFGIDQMKQDGRLSGVGSDVVNRVDQQVTVEGRVEFGVDKLIEIYAPVPFEKARMIDVKQGFFELLQDVHGLLTGSTFGLKFLF